MPLLPWLPASRKKRFPVAKRSPKANELAIVATVPNEKVSQDLRGIFGSSKSEKNGDVGSIKKKRSSDDSHALTANDSKKNVMPVMHEHSNMMHVHEARKKHKRDVSDPDDDDEADNENGINIFPCFINSI